MPASRPITAPSTTASPEYRCDVLVIGGGPGGSTISAFLVQKGWKVVLLEKEHHPRFHIGESLLPLNLPLLQRLGVLDQVDQIGLLKPGAEFNYEGYEPAVYYFAKATDVREGVKVTEVEFRRGSTSLVHAVDEHGQEQGWETRFVVDASGRDTFLANRFNIKSRNPVHSSSAVFGHFKGAVRRPGRDEGNISVYWFDHGWYWMIPLRGGAMSIGAVCWTYYMKTRKVSVDQFLLDTIALCPMMAERLKDAKLMAPALATGNFSYRATRMTGDGYLMVGDAYAFIDPVFSSGVFLAMNSGELGAGVVDEALRNGDVSARSLRRYERTVKHGLKTFSWFIYRITTPALREMFMSPTHSFRLEEAILSLLSADIFGKTPIRGPLLVFKIIYYVTSIVGWRESLTAWLKRRRAWRTKLDFVWKSGN